MLEEED